MHNSSLRTQVIRLAHKHPELRKDLLSALKNASETFPPIDIGAISPKVEGEDGENTISDARKPWMQGEFTQQENSELASKQEKGLLSDGKADLATKKARVMDAARKGKSAKEASTLAFQTARSLGESPESATRVARSVFRSWKA